MTYPVSDMRPVIVHASLAGSRPFPALLGAGKLLALAHWQAEWPFAGGSLRRLLAEWPRHGDALQALCHDPATASTLEQHGANADLFRLHAPVAPRQIYCTIGNYSCQALEAAADADDGPLGPGAAQRREAARQAVAQRRSNGTPYICLKGLGSLAGPDDELAIDADHTTLDWEVEVGVVIGRRALRVRAEDAWSHVAGCCVVNDLTLRDRIFRDDVKALGTDWIRSKSSPGWLHAGPWLVPAATIADPQNLRLRLHLNGQLMQDGSSRDMVFTIAQQIAYLSTYVPLEPGDLICTGSPAGFGSHHRRFLRPGDRVEAWVEGLGTQRMRCVDGHA